VLAFALYVAIEVVDDLADDAIDLLDFENLGFVKQTLILRENRLNRSFKDVWLFIRVVLVRRRRDFLNHWFLL
jgi:hypothetical protein